MNQIHAMRVFVRVAETQSFRRAAQQLDVSNALVTRAIATLEAHLHIRLINRTTRNVSLTDAGQRYLEGCRSLLEELDHLEHAVAHTEREPSGTLRVFASGVLALPALTPLIDGYRRRYPRVQVRLTVDECNADPIDDGYDVGVVAASTAPAPAPGGELIARALGTSSFVPCAAPSWLAEHGEPHSPAQLTLHASVSLPPEQQSPTWRFVRGGDAQSVTLQPAYAVNRMLMVRLAALAGMGIAILPAPLVADDLAHGTLRRLLPDYEIEDADAQLSIVYPGRRHLPAKTRSFIDYALEHAAHGRPATAARPGCESTNADARAILQPAISY